MDKQATREEQQRNLYPLPVLPAPDGLRGGGEPFNLTQKLEGSTLCFIQQANKPPAT
jgi:hypothetical protein